MKIFDTNKRYNNICSAIIIVALLLFFAGCGTSEKDSCIEEVENDVYVSAENEITLATLGISNFENAVVNYNEFNNNGYKVTIIDYQKNGTVDAAINRLNMELASGNGPDIIDFECFPSRELYGGHGYLLDMSDYFNAEFKRDEYFVLDIIDPSEMYFFPSNFSIMTCCGLENAFPDINGLSVDEYMELSSTPQYSSNPAETQTSFMDAICYGVMDSFVDMKTRKCSFCDGRFSKLLEFAKTLDAGGGQSNQNLVQLLTSGSLMYMNTWVSTPLDIRDAEREVGAPLSYIGYPTLDNSNGSYIYLSALAGVNSATEYPEIAWDFLKYLISDEALQSTAAWYSIPINKTACQKYVDELLRPYAKYDGHEITLNEDGSFNVDGVHMDQEYDPAPIVSEKQIAKFYGLIQSSTKIYEYDPNIYSIIKKSAARYFANEQSVEETVSDIQSRVSIYLSEQG